MPDQRRRFYQTVNQTEDQTDQKANQAMCYRGTEGTRPYAEAGWYYAEYRDRVSAEFIEALARHLGWSTGDRILDLGAGPGQLSLLIAPLAAEVMAIEPEPDMLREGQKRAQAAGIDNVKFISGSSDDLPALRASLGLFRAALMGQSFHWMVEKDCVLQDLSAMIDRTDGAVAFVRPLQISIPDELRNAQEVVHEILERYLVTVPPGPHPNGRHEAFEEILKRSPFPKVEMIERVYEARLRPTIESLIGAEYTISHVLTRLSDNRAAFEREVHTALEWFEDGREISAKYHDEALIGRR
jgi:SAM-dependent methyltransferase